MFDGDVTGLPTADLLESAAEHRALANRADARLLVHAQVYADRFHPDVCPVRPGRRGGRGGGGRERAVVLGGEGCPEIAEFAVAEFAVMLGVSPRVAADYLGNALALRHRFPFTWARVLAGEATPWKACRLVAECSKLSEEAARYVDQRVAGLIDSITPYRLDKIVKAAKFHADPDRARAEADEKSRERGVWLGRSDEHGTKSMFIKASSGAVTRHDATLAGIADALKTFGDTRPVQARRADAVGILADPAFTQELLHQAHEFLKTTPIGQAAAPSSEDQPPDTPTDDRAAHPALATPATPATPAQDVAVAQSAAATTGKDANAAWDAAAGASTTKDQNAASATGQHGASVADVPADAAASAADARARGTGSAADTRAHGIAPTADPAPGQNSARSADPIRGPRADQPPTDPAAHPGDDDLLNDRVEPGPDDEADRDAPHPSHSDLPDPLDAPSKETIEPFDPGMRLNTDTDTGEPLDDAARRALDARLAQIRHQAHTDPSGRLRPRQTEIYVHLTDHTLATGTGVLRAETIGPLLASQLTELVGHGPYTVKPVIDLNDAVSVDAYEIPDRIRERVKLTHPTEVFPYGTRETHPTMDLDHIQPYDPLGPPGQTNTTNLAPLGRFTHRVKTHAHGWNVQRIDHRTLEWTTPHGFTFHVTPTGTHRIQPPCRAPDSS